MSLAASLAPLARTLITPEGTALAFSRTTNTTDPISNVSVPSTVTWTSVGMFLKADVPTISQVNGRRVVTRTLLVPGLGLTITPRAGDSVTAAGVTYTVGAVEVTAQTDGVTAPLVRVTVTA